MALKKKKKEIQKLLDSFGKPKEDPFNFDLIESYFTHKNNSNTFQVISDKTCVDLDFEELFAFADRTHSKVGQQFLYNKLRVIPESSSKKELQENIIKEIIRNQDLRVDVQLQLEKLNNDDSYYISSLFQNEHLEPPKWFIFIKFLSFISLISLLLLPFNIKIFFVLFVVFIINVIIHYWNKKNLYRYLGSIPQLLKLNKIARELFKNESFKAINPSLPESISIIDKVKNKMSYFKLEANFEGDFEALFWSLLELIKALFLLEPLLLFGVLKQLDTKRKEIEDVFAFVGEIDSLISIASLRIGLQKYCIPEILGLGKEMTAREVYHPLIPECIENDIRIDKKSVLLTGSNMSGKTTFIRTIGINVLTGLTINTCFAKEFAMPRMRIYSAIRISDDLMNDKSYYFEEVLTIKTMIEKTNNGEPNIFLLDEIFKGTNTVERISAGKAVLSSLSKNNNIVFVSTHDIELADLLNNDYCLYHFSETIDNLTVGFDYKLKDGKLKNRNAIKILQINDYPENIIEEAIEISKTLDGKRD